MHHAHPGRGAGLLFPDGLAGVVEEDVFKGGLADGDGGDLKCVSPEKANQFDDMSLRVMEMDGCLAVVSFGLYDPFRGQDRRDGRGIR